MASSLNPQGKAFRSNKQSHISTPFNNDIQPYPLPRSSKQGSLRRNPSRLGKIAKREERTLRGLAQASPFSPRRDHFSLKNKNLSSKREIEQQVLSEPLLNSPGRGKLAWARKPVSATVPSSDNTHKHPHSPTSIFNRLKLRTDRPTITCSSNRQILPNKMW